MKNKCKLDFISIFFLLGPWLDVASFLNIGGTFSLSVILRTLFFGILFIQLMKRKNCFKELALIFGVGGILFFYSVFLLKQGMFSSLSATLKLLYLPMLLLYFKNYSWEGDKYRILEIVLFTYLGIFLCSYLFGFGADAYLETDGKSGFKGLFSSINEFSAIVVSLLFFVGTYLKREKKYLPLILLFILSFWVSLLIGTKVLLGGILLTLCYFLYLERKFLFLDRSLQVKSAIVLLAVVFLLGGGFLFTRTRTYQNMKIQQDFFQVTNIVSYDFMNRVLFNDRLTFLKDNFDYYKEQSPVKQILGIGISDYEVKMVEIDFFDLLFRYGVFGLLFFVVVFIVWMPWKCMKIEAIFATILLLLISFTSGHVLIYPAVCIYFGCFSTFLKEGKKL